MLSSKTYLITGASSGIGLAISYYLLEQGHSVIGLARDFSTCSLMSQSKFKAYCVDLAHLPTLPEHLKHIETLCTSLDGIIMCAGQGIFGTLDNFSHEKIQYLINLNLTSPLFLLKTFTPKLREKESSDIILLGSEAGLNGAKQGSIYCASKFGLRGVAQSLRKECSAHNIRVSLINPGPIDTPFFDDLLFEPQSGREYSLEATDIVEAVKHILSLPPHVVIEEYNIQPMKRSFKNKKSL
ncbi:MAG: SDR family oxidoreductase [Pseudomonadota bacterium]